MELDILVRIFYTIYVRYNLKLCIFHTEHLMCTLQTISYYELTLYVCLNVQLKLYLGQQA